MLTCETLGRTAQSPYVLDIDRASLDKCNAIHHNDERVIVESIPEPFIGNPQSAKVVLLSLNPGHSEDDAKAHSDAAFRDAMMRNLRHEAQDCPFYGMTDHEVREAIRCGYAKPFSIRCPALPIIRSVSCLLGTGHSEYSRSRNRIG